MKRFVDPQAHCDRIDRAPLRVDNGRADVRTAPALGVDVALDGLARHPYTGFPHKDMRRHRKQFPRRGSVRGVANATR